MKATVNGISIEGTPQEVADYVRIVTAPKTNGSDWYVKSTSPTIYGPMTVSSGQTSVL